MYCFIDSPECVKEFIYFACYVHKKLFLIYQLLDGKQTCFATFAKFMYCIFVLRSIEDDFAIKSKIFFWTKRRSAVKELARLRWMMLSNNAEKQKKYNVLRMVKMRLCPLIYPISDAKSLWNTKDDGDHLCSTDNWTPDRWKICWEWANTTTTKFIETVVIIIIIIIKIENKQTVRHIGLNRLMNDSHPFSG